MAVDIAILERAAEVAVQRALTRVVQPIIRHGTCIEPSIASPGIHEILVDGDSESIACHDVTGGVNMNTGTRVTILFAPPHQALIIGMVDPEGPVRQQIIEVDDATRTVTGITDMELLAVPLVGGHTYGVHTHALVETASVVAAARWEVRLNDNGAQHDRIWQLSPGVVGTAQVMLDSIVYYVPDESADYDLQVAVVEVTNGMDIHFLGGTDHRRTLTVFDYGIVAEIAP